MSQSNAYSVFLQYTNEALDKIFAFIVSLV